jgi:GTP-binding protein
MTTVTCPPTARPRDVSTVLTVAPIVVIVGRPNVGKSTLYNRLVGRRAAIVDNAPGVTRDRREGDARLGDLQFRIVDTAGFEDARGGDLAARIQTQTARALAEADLALFLIDARAGVTPVDRELANLLRRDGIPTILLANKCEGRFGEYLLADAYALGLGEPIPFSAEHGEGLGLLYDAFRPFISDAPKESVSQGEPTSSPTTETDSAAPLQLAVVGRPNVGKSTLINRLIGDERLVTGPEAGITRDAIAVDWTFQGRKLRLLDTAGLRRRAKIDSKLEELAGADALRAVRFAQVVVIVIDATVGLENQDLTIAGLVVDEGRAPVLALNKWDRVADRRITLDAVTKRLEQSLPQVRGLRVVPVSALTGEGLDNLLPTVLQVYDVWTRQVPTPRLNRWLAEMTTRHAPPSAQGRPVKIRYVSQTKSRPPSFLLFANRPREVPDSYLRYLANGLRDSFGLAGVPLRLTLRRSRNPYGS